MTDGRQTKGKDAPDAKPLHLASRELKEGGVQVYSLGIGNNYDIGELIDIASDDASVFRSTNMDELVSIVATISEQTCKGNSFNSVQSVQSGYSSQRMTKIFGIISHLVNH